MRDGAQVLPGAAFQSAAPVRRRRRALWTTPGIAAGAVLLGVVVALAVLAGPLAVADPMRTGGPILAPPSARHPLGTDQLGRDLWSGILYGARTSLVVGVGATVLATAAGVLAGAVAALYGGWWDEGPMRLAEVFHVVPRILVALLLVPMFGGSWWTLVPIIALTGWPGIARLVRSEVLSLREREFALAARALGATGRRLLARHLLPNAWAPVLVSLPLQVGRAILLESGLSFLGLGDPATASWGRLLQGAQGYLRSAWWLAVFPGTAVTATVLALYLLAEGLHLRSTPALAGIERREAQRRAA